MIPSKVNIVEVGLRDGLQNEKTSIPLRQSSVARGFYSEWS